MIAESLLSCEMPVVQLPDFSNSFEAHPESVMFEAFQIIVFLES